MEHIAIDLGGSQSQVCTRASDGTVILERRVRTRDLPELLARRPPGRVVLETCAEAFFVADAAQAAGHQVRVVPATLVRSLGVGSRGLKNDRRDGRVLSEVSCRIDLPSVHVPSRQARERKSKCGMRDALVHSRTLLINNVRGWLRASLRRPKRGTTKTFALRVRALCGAELPSFVEPSLQAIDALSTQIATLERELVAEAKQDPVCRRLMTVPGVGWVTALRFVATLDEIGRFPDAHRLESYLGLVPGERSSSERQQRTGITKAGSPSMRATLVQAAWAAWRARRKDPMQLWTDQVAQRRGKRVAVTALARKLAGIMFAVWRDGTTYQPQLDTTVPAQVATMP
jgi:transposase